MLFNYYRALYVVHCGKFLLYAKLNCNSFEVFVVTCYSCVALAISLEKFRDCRLIRENRKIFPPCMICSIKYITVQFDSNLKHVCYTRMYFHACSE